MDQDAFQRRQAVGRQFHHEWGRWLARKQRALEDHAAHDGQDDAQQVQAEDELPGVVGEEGGGEDGVDRQPRPATHHGHQQPGQHPVVLALQRPRSVDSGHGAAKADQHGHEGLAVQPQRVHQPVHHEGGAGHVARILQQRQEEVQEEKHWHEDQHSAHAGDDAIHHQRLEPGTSQPDEIEDSYYPAGDGAADDPVHPVQVGAGDLGGHLEDEPHGG